jgi:5-methylcytosine-specific restriction endonuclease McrA
MPGSPREREREADRRFKARLRGSQVISFTHEDLRLKRAYWGSRCYLCGEVTDGFDHVKPLYRRGAHALANLRPCCIPCNVSKGRSWPLPANQPSLFPLERWRLFGGWIGALRRPSASKETQPYRTGALALRLDRPKGF